MVENRARKFEGLKAEVQELEFLGTKDPKILLIGWGSIYGPLKEGAERLQKEGISIGD
jgi:2-oxoglutarate ferredoxin oxidoreductase subunit alpha